MAEIQPNLFDRADAAEQTQSAPDNPETTLSLVDQAIASLEEPARTAYCNIFSNNPALKLKIEQEMQAVPRKKIRSLVGMLRTKTQKALGGKHVEEQYMQRAVLQLGLYMNTGNEYWYL